MTTRFVADRSLFYQLLDLVRTHRQWLDSGVVPTLDTPYNGACCPSPNCTWGDVLADALDRARREESLPIDPELCDGCGHPRSEHTGCLHTGSTGCNCRGFQRRQERNGVHVKTCCRCKQLSPARDMLTVHGEIWCYACYHREPRTPVRRYTRNTQQIRRVRAAVAQLKQGNPHPISVCEYGAHDVVVRYRGRRIRIQSPSNKTLAMLQAEVVENLSTIDKELDYASES